MVEDVVISSPMVTVRKLRQGVFLWPCQSYDCVVKRSVSCNISCGKLRLPGDHFADIVYPKLGHG